MVIAVWGGKNESEEEAHLEEHAEAVDPVPEEGRAALRLRALHALEAAARGLQGLQAQVRGRRRGDLGSCLGA